LNLPYLKLNARQHVKKSWEFLYFSASFGFWEATRKVSLHFSHICKTR
jgi:hypothetical protein